MPKPEAIGTGEFVQIQGRHEQAVAEAMCNRAKARVTDVATVQRAGLRHVSAVGLSRVLGTRRAGRVSARLREGCAHGDCRCWTTDSALITPSSWKPKRQ